MPNYASFIFIVILDDLSIAVRGLKIAELKTGGNRKGPFLRPFNCYRNHKM